MNNFVFISTESAAPAGAIIMKKALALTRQDELSQASKYCDVFDDIAIIMRCYPQEYLGIFGKDEVINFQWKRRYADIRLMIDWNDFFFNSDEDGKLLLVKNTIIKSLMIVDEKCKKEKFDSNLIFFYKIFLDKPKVITRLTCSEINHLTARINCHDEINHASADQF